jgi:hypothetical protein
MSRFSGYLIMIGLFWMASGLAARAQDDPFAGTPSPSPDFLSNHSYDSTDVDGTSFNSQKEDGVNRDSADEQSGQVKKNPTPDDSKSKTKNENDGNGSDSDSKSQDPNTL